MIISRTPYRLSFFGGGTDYPEWYNDNGGLVVSATINKYCYITCRQLPKFFDHKSRIVYSNIELVQNNNDIIHPGVRESLRYMNIEDGVEINHDGDLPARSGIGSSSSFVVGLLNSLYCMKNIEAYPKLLADGAITVERVLSKEAGGHQDQIAVAYGGLNKIEFKADEYHVENLNDYERLKELEKYIILFFTGTTRDSGKIAQSYIDNLDEKREEYKRTHEAAIEASEIIKRGKDFTKLGTLMHEMWLNKCKRGQNVNNDKVNKIYDDILDAGALGGKITGAGSAGFLMVFVEPEYRMSVLERLNYLLNIPFKFEHQTKGTKIIYS